MLAHDTYGREGAPRVVLLHGWPLNRRIWSAVATELGKDGFHVLCPDLPGFGESAPLSADRWTVEAFAVEVGTFLRGTAGGRVAIAGHSFGGYVALALAERDRDSVAGLGLVSSRTIADSEAARAGRFVTMEKVRAQGVQALLPDLAAKLLAPAAPEPLRSRAAETIRACPSEAVVAGLAAMAARPDRTAVFEAFPRPRLVLHGEADQLIPVAEAARAERRAAPAHRVLLRAVGHMPMWEAVPETVDALRVWAQAAHGL